ncbi:MAG: hypothetical protein H0T89_09575 [Deltaproteobacteria bacterium]|nr:hypothetical protein [Deltaproteobacteria bacterium]MDQ3301656.1 hypothetical protein [Myxococcota bacterium]
MCSIVAVLSLAACGARQQNSETLAESIRSYNEGIRWQRYAIAAALIPPAERSKFVEDMDERAEDLRITDYEVVNVARSGKTEAKVQVKVSWYMDSEGTLRETHAVQTWQRTGKTWMMVEEARMRGHEMPGLLEPIEDGKPAGAAPHPAKPGPQASIRDVGPVTTAPVESHQ